ncbi:ABC transporter permease [Pseudoruegeria sp. SHC-113]|uniref:ABC transporter permease n=1 Tax=Pseudoruegeria sp. SHC-113 TaxID=2855439 RepID=UPI0021BB4ADA|nr:ABC transporter permease [Pseudoruegeria sp. SHC-113]MCT8160669.1 ABC transporter permease [Pseudoruegeria sp. SHC-113]
MAEAQNSSTAVSNPGATSRWLERLRHEVMQVWQVIAALALIYLVFFVLSPPFRSFDTLLSIFGQASILAVLACGTTVVLISGGLDLSVGSIFAVVGVSVGIFLAEMELPVALAVVAGLGIGAGLGALNGLIQVATGVPAFIVTLGGLTAYKGLAEILASGRDLSRFPEAFQSIGAGYMVPMAIMFAAAILTGLFLTKTRLGLRAFAIGGNAEVARLAGVPVKKSRVYYYMLGGALAALAAIMEVAKLNFAMPARGQSYELFAIAAVVIGGTSLFGGRGGVGKTLIGMLIMQTITVGLSYLGVGTSYQRIAIGLIIIAAVYWDVWRRSTR